MKNEATMLLHLIMFTIYFISSVMKTYSISMFIADNNKQSKKESVTSYILSIYMLFFVQLIMVYLFIKFSQSVNTIIDRKGAGCVTLKVMIKGDKKSSRNALKDQTLSLIEKDLASATSGTEDNE